MVGKYQLNSLHLKSLLHLHFPCLPLMIFSVLLNHQFSPRQEEWILFFTYSVRSKPLLYAAAAAHKTRMAPFSQPDHQAACLHWPYIPATLVVAATNARIMLAWKNLLNIGAATCCLACKAARNPEILWAGWASSSLCRQLIYCSTETAGFYWPPSSLAFFTYFLCYQQQGRERRFGIHFIVIFAPATKNIENTSKVFRLLFSPR